MLITGVFFFNKPKVQNAYTFFKNDSELYISCIFHFNKKFSSDCNLKSRFGQFLHFCFSTSSSELVT